MSKKCAGQQMKYFRAICHTFSQPQISAIIFCYDSTGDNQQDYILLHLTAQIKEIYVAYQNMYNVWFPKDGARFADRMGFDKYIYVNADATYM